MSPRRRAPTRDSRAAIPRQHRKGTPLHPSLPNKTAENGIWQYSPHKTAPAAYFALAFHACIETAALDRPYSEVQFRMRGVCFVWIQGFRGPGSKLWEANDHSQRTTYGNGKIGAKEKEAFIEDCPCRFSLVKLKKLNSQIKSLVKLDTTCFRAGLEEEDKRSLRQ